VFWRLRPRLGCSSVVTTGFARLSVALRLCTFTNRTLCQLSPLTVRHRGPPRPVRRIAPRDNNRAPTKSQDYPQDLETCPASICFVDRRTLRMYHSVLPLDHPIISHRQSVRLVSSDLLRPPGRYSRINTLAVSLSSALFLHLAPPTRRRRLCTHAQRISPPIYIEYIQKYTPPPPPPQPAI
jgi:hypothetical protein